MSFEIVYLDNGDLIAEFDTRDQALAALERTVEDNPDLIDRLGLLSVDEDGDPARAVEPAAHLLARA